MGAGPLDLRELFALGPCDHALDRFISERLAEAGVWPSPRTSDGLMTLRVVEREPERVRVCGSIYEISQELHPFWLDLAASPSPGWLEWILHFDLDGLSPRHRRDAIFLAARAEELDWVTVLSGSIEVVDGVPVSSSCGSGRS